MLILVYTASPVLLGGQLCQTFRLYPIAYLLLLIPHPFVSKRSTLSIYPYMPHNICNCSQQLSCPPLSSQLLVAVCFRSRPCTHPTTHTPKPAFCWILSTSLLGFLMLSLVCMNIITMTIFTSCYTLAQPSAVPISRFCCLLCLHILLMMPYLIPLVICDCKAMCYSLFAIEIAKV